MNKLQRLLLITLCLSLFASLAGANGLEDRVTEHRLANGMKLLMVERHSSPTSCRLGPLQSGKRQ